MCVTLVYGLVKGNKNSRTDLFKPRKKDYKPKTGKNVNKKQNNSPHSSMHRKCKLVFRPVHNNLKHIYLRLTIGIKD